MTTIEKLFTTIKQRQKTKPKKYYTAQLFKAGTARICQKIGEEGVETALAGVSKKKKAIIYEMADLWYHCLVLLANQKLTPQDIEKELKKRFK